MAIIVKPSNFNTRGGPGYFPGKVRNRGKVRHCDNERSYLYIVILIESQFLEVNFSKRLVALHAGRFK